jgi:plastocyanin
MEIPETTKTCLLCKARIDFEGSEMNREHLPITGIRLPTTTFIAVALMVLSMALRTEAGSITGVVLAEGKKGADADVQGGRYENRQFKFVERVNYSEMKDFVVYIEGKVGTNPEPPSKPVQVITRRVLQHGAMFAPHVLPVMVGTTVEWPNNDDILHNVFSFSEAKQFDLGLYKSPEVGRVVFDKPGRVDVFCSIHSRMNCIVLVLENPYFAATNDKGDYTIINVPAGTYKLKAWHERLPSQLQEVTVPEKGEVKVDFTLGIKNLPKS